MKFILENDSKLQIYTMYIQPLIETNEKIHLAQFFKSIHSNPYSNYHISFIWRFLELQTQEVEEMNRKLECFINNLDIRIDQLVFSQNIRPEYRSG